MTKEEKDSYINELEDSLSLNISEREMIISNLSFGFIALNFIFLSGSCSIISIAFFTGCLIVWCISSFMSDIIHSFMIKLMYEDQDLTDVYERKWTDKILDVVNYLYSLLFILGLVFFIIGVLL